MSLLCTRRFNPWKRWPRILTTHKWVASSTHDSPVQLRLPFKASKRTLEGVFKWLEQCAGASAYCCTSTASDYSVVWKSQRRGVYSLGARPRHEISSWSTRFRFQSEFRIQQQIWSSNRHWVTAVQDAWNVSYWRKITLKCTTSPRPGPSGQK